MKYFLDLIRLNLISSLLFIIIIVAIIMSLDFTALIAVVI